MNEMIERVARAIFLSSMGMHAPASWEQCNEGQKENVRRQARAAMDAMKNYTFDMEQAGMNAMKNGEPFELVWATAINTGLR